GRALSSGGVELRAHDLRAFGLGERRQVDDVPFGGGPGMVLKPEPLFAAVRAVRALGGTPPEREILLSAHGRPLASDLIEQLAGAGRVLLVCGRYQGVDERVHRGLGLEEVSVGDFVVSGGELPAMILIEAVARRLPGTLGDPESTRDESFSAAGLEHPHYTRPAVFEGMAVPEVLRSGDHAGIERWRAEAAQERARRLRPELVPAVANGAEFEKQHPALGRRGADARLGGAP
ncbi:MAG: tRNA (guanosine(37)-N1)-methyltransferase TrmD, partial [Candidatus Dormibacteria bacterium]